MTLSMGTSTLLIKPETIKNVGKTIEFVPRRYPPNGETMSADEPAEDPARRDKLATWQKCMRKLKRYATWRYSGPAMLAGPPRRNDKAGDPQERDE